MGAGRPSELQDGMRRGIWIQVPRLRLFSAGRRQDVGVTMLWAKNSVISSRALSGRT